MNDGGGNLSDNLVEERFKVLSENKKQLFTELGTEFERRQIGSASDILEWGAYLGKKLKTSDLADLFTKWMFFHQPKLSDGINSIDFKNLRDYLAATNWKTANEEYDRVFDLMWNSRSDYPAIFLLKTLNKHFLAVEVNPHYSNLTNILGIRYHTDGATKEMIIAPFGQILFCTHPEGSSFPWRISEYALVLEIREDRVAGDFYFVYNAAEAEDDAVNLKPALCGQGPFIVGKEKQSWVLNSSGVVLVTI